MKAIPAMKLTHFRKIDFSAPLLAASDAIYSVRPFQRKSLGKSVIPLEADGWRPECASKMVMLFHFNPYNGAANVLFYVCCTSIQIFEWL